jgi:hypothetical protein
MDVVWRPLLALGIGMVLALGADQVVRRFTPPPSSENTYWYLQTVQYHPVLGWSGYPNFTTTKDGIAVQTNSRGYRDREPVDVADARASGVLFLGDSFTWGDEVTQEERFSSQLEASCGSLCGRLPPIRAINKGIIGYGTAQSFLDYLLTPDRHRFDIVILALFTGNDLTDNAAVNSPSGPRPRLIRCDRQDAGTGLCLEGVPVPPLVDWPEHRLIDPRGPVMRSFGWSGMVTLASRRRAPRALLEKRIADGLGGMLQALPFPVVERTSDAPVRDRIGQLEAILRAMDRTIHADGKTFGVLVFPSGRVYTGDAVEESRDYSAVLGVLERLRIPFADYYGHTRSLRMEDLYFAGDGHWRASGHQEAATLLRSLLVTLTEDAAPGR